MKEFNACFVKQFVRSLFIALCNGHSNGTVEIDGLINSIKRSAELKQSITITLVGKDIMRVGEAELSIPDSVSGNFLMGFATLRESIAMQLSSMQEHGITLITTMLSDSLRPQYSESTSPALVDLDICFMLAKWFTFANSIFTMTVSDKAIDLTLTIQTDISPTRPNGDKIHSRIKIRIKE